MKRIIFIVFCLCLPVFALAADITNIFTPPAISNGTDLSIQYLGDIFGIVDGVLHGSGSQIMGQMFMVFNAGALALGGIIVIYTSMISLMNTAHEGEVMGKKWSSIWIPLRTVLGIGVLIPKATGYCAIQIFMMWVIVQGVGLADTIWNQAVGYLAEGGVIIQQSLAPTSSVATATQSLFSQTVCLQGLQTLFNNAYTTASQNNQNPPPIPSFIGSTNPLTPICSGKNCTASLPYFPSNIIIPGGAFNWSTLNGACGTVSWPNSGSNTSGAAVAKEIGGEVQTAYQQAIQVGVQQILLDMSGPAQAYINNTLYPATGVSPQPLLTTLSNGTTTYTYINFNVFLQASEDYEGITYPAQRTAAAGKEAEILAEWTTGASNQGWINAGAYYQFMALANDNVQSANFTPPSGTSNANIASAINSIVVSGNYPSTLGNINTTSLQNAISTGGSDLNKFITAAATANAKQEGSTSGNNNAVFQGLTLGISGYMEVILGPLISPLLDIINSFMALTSAQQTNSNPVVAISVMGIGLIGLVIEVWIAGAITLAAATGLLDSIPCVNEGNVMDVLVQWIIPFLWGLCGMMFVEGIIMAYYIPMIPYILFLFGVIGWIMATVEAMVAAPLIALGITHPEGAEVLGKADPAVLLLVNVFMRPSMMIIGFIAAIILSYVSVWILNVGYWRAFGEALASTAVSTSGLGTLLSFPFILILYVSLVIGLLNSSFQLINVVPDKVLRWIGGQVEGVAGEAGKALGEAKQGVSQAAQGMAQSAEGVAKSAGTRADKQKAGAEIDEGGDKGGSGKGKKSDKEMNVAEKK